MNPVLTLFSGLFKATILVVLFSSCSQGKIAQCQKIISTTKKVEAISQENRQTQDLDDILAVADSFADSATSLEKMKLSDQRLSRFQLQLAQIYSGNAKSTRNFISAFEARDIPGVRLAKQEVQLLGKQEQQVVAEINQYCQLAQ